MSERDPKTDARPGDVLRGSPFGKREFTVTDRRDNGCGVTQKPPFRPRVGFVPAAAWLEWSKTATIVRRAEQAEGKQ